MRLIKNMMIQKLLKKLQITLTSKFSVNCINEINKENADIKIKLKLELIPKENAGKVTVDEAENKIVDPNYVEDTTDELQTKNNKLKKQKNMDNHEGKTFA